MGQATWQVFPAPQLLGAPQLPFSLAAPTPLPTSSLLELCD